MSLLLKYSTLSLNSLNKCLHYYYFSQLFHFLFLAVLSSLSGAMPTHTPTKICTYEYKSSKYAQSGVWLSFGYCLQSQVFSIAPDLPLHFVLSFFSYVCCLCTFNRNVSWFNILVFDDWVHNSIHFKQYFESKNPQWICRVSLSIHFLAFMNIQCINIHFSCLIIATEVHCLYFPITSFIDSYM